MWNKMILSVRHQDKGIVSHVDASSIICTLVDNDKLVNQIAILLPVVVKKMIPQDSMLAYPPAYPPFPLPSPY